MAIIVAVVVVVLTCFTFSSLVLLIKHAKRLQNITPACSKCLWGCFGTQANELKEEMAMKISSQYVSIHLCISHVFHQTDELWCYMLIYLYAYACY